MKKAFIFGEFLKYNWNSICKYKFGICLKIEFFCETIDDPETMIILNMRIL